MKAINIFKKIAIIFLIVFFSSCVEEDDYSVPDDLGSIENKNLQALIDPANGYQQKTIQQVKEMFVNDEVYQITSDIYVKGYVVSSDETGNFYKELYLQDDPVNPSNGIKLMLNRSDVFGKYNFGREVYVNLKELYVGELNSGDGVIAIGWAADYTSIELDEIAEDRANLQVLRSNVTAPIVALPINVLRLNSDYIGMFVRIDHVQFPSNIAGQASYVHPLDDFDTTIILESCDGFGNSNFKLETSKFTSFKDLTLPSGAGFISGIITRDYEGDHLVMVLNDHHDVAMNDARCTALDIADFTSFFSEDFEGMTNNTTVSGNGWTNFAEQGFNYWKVSITNDLGNSESKIAKITANYSNDNDNVAWLISPPIDLDSHSDEFVRFQTSNSFSDNSDLDLLISTEWNGVAADITSVNWSVLPGFIVDDAEHYENWVNSGAINLSLYSGTTYIAFRYKGGDNNTNQTGTYELDNFEVLVR